MPRRFHGYTDAWLDGRWVKATPSFDQRLCARFEVAPLEFDGVYDAVLPPLLRGARAAAGRLRQGE